MDSNFLGSWSVIEKYYVVLSDVWKTSIFFNIDKFGFPGASRLFNFKNDNQLNIRFFLIFSSTAG